MPDRVVIEASAAGRQQELIQSLREAGAELILDTNIAELSSLGRFSGAAREAPWANPLAMLDFTRLERPIVADGVGGLAAVAIAAFGAAGGICHGVAEKERFDASSWSKPPKTGGGGREKRILIGAVDRLLSVKQLETLMVAPGARKALSCHDRHCCPNGLDDMLKDPKAHYLRQRGRQIADLARVPDSRRIRHFLDQELAPTERAARNAAKLKVADESLVELLTRSSERLEKMHAVLEDLGSTVDGAPRAASPERSRSARATPSLARR
jgi:hypothetical protein